MDTSQALLVREASRLIEHNLVRLGEVLERRAWEFKDTPEIGRTHGVHAEPITFGLKIANWFAENRRDLERLRTAAGKMAVGKISGAVGNCSTWDRISKRKFASGWDLQPRQSRRR